MEETFEEKVLSYLEDIEGRLDDIESGVEEILGEQSEYDDRLKKCQWLLEAIYEKQLNSRKFNI